MSITAIGIDPGKSGAIAVLPPDGTPLLADCPTLRVGKRTESDPAGMARLLRPYAGRSDVLVAVERVGARPGQGVTSMFTFGTNWGVWLGAIAALGLPCQLVRPQEWHRVMLAGEPKGKGSSIAVARRLFPDAAEQLTRVKDDGRAEALLLAEYARRQSGNLCT